MGTVFDLLLRIFGWIFNFLKYIGKRLWTTLGVQKYAKWAWKHLEFWIFGIFGILGHFFSCGKGNLGILPTLPNQPQNAKWARKRLISGQNADSVSLQVPQPASLEKSKYFIFALFDFVGLDLQKVCSAAPRKLSISPQTYMLVNGFWLVTRNNQSNKEPFPAHI